MKKISKKLFKNLTIRYIIQITRRKRAKCSIKRRKYCMKLEKKNLIVERPYKSVYKTEEGVVKIFVTDHPKSAVFNEALNTVKVEETGLDIPKLKEVTQINGEWALVIETGKEKLWKK